MSIQGEGGSGKTSGEDRDSIPASQADHGGGVDPGASEGLITGERTAVPPTTKLLTEDDIRTGMALAQTVYAVIMTLGLKVAAEALYPALFARERVGSGALSPVLVSMAFLAILLVAIRFFWVPRNLYEYVHHHMKSRDEEAMRQTFRSLMLYHFPIALIHTLLFFGVCEAFAEMTKSTEATHAPIIHFVWIYTGLLALNAGWLIIITPSDTTGPGRAVWARNNMICAGLAAGVLAGFYLAGFSILALLLGTWAIFTVNSVLDLVVAADKYILFDS
jgi:hypothetical protein